VFLEQFICGSGTRSVRGTGAGCVRSGTRSVRGTGAIFV
jgi:hypothetical protein